MANRPMLKGKSSIGGRKGAMISVNKNITFKQFSKKDSDKDGVVNSKDCKPFNKKEQGVVHDLLKKVKVKIKEIKRERKKIKFIEKRLKVAEDKQEILRLKKEKRVRLKKVKGLSKETKDKMKVIEKAAIPGGAFLAGLGAITAGPVGFAASTVVGATYGAVTAGGIKAARKISDVRAKRRKKQLSELKRTARARLKATRKVRQRVSQLRKELERAKR